MESFWNYFHSSNYSQQNGELIWFKKKEENKQLQKLAKYILLN